MEMKSGRLRRRWCTRAGLSLFLLLLFAAQLYAQAGNRYYIRDSRMYIELRKDIPDSELDHFIMQYDLKDLDLKNFIRSNSPGALHKQGWEIIVNNKSGLIISKKMEAFNGSNNSTDRFLLTERPPILFPATNNGLLYGVNRFRNKLPFTVIDSTTVFFLRNNKQAKQVMLAGSFNNWQASALAMKQTDSGWIAEVKLGPGKYWYKFIVDGKWIVDNDNEWKENDGLGNTNSVFFRPNRVFVLPGFTREKRVFLAGSFNDWRPNELPMMKTASGWTLPLFLAEGTHTYKFVVGEQWVEDENNKEKLPDGHGGFNSVVRMGNAHLFRLNGFPGAMQVAVSGTFNGWRTDELFLEKTASGWELPYTLGPGNYEYKFVVDGKSISDPLNPLQSNAGASYLIIEPNYTFLLKGFEDARSVYLSGDFNNWDPHAFAMKKEGGEWVLRVHLSAGKHLYKFLVDGRWMIDPANKLWEQNEYNTGNSVLWIAH